MLVEREVGDEPFQSTIFLFQLPEPVQLTHAQVRALLFPGVEKVASLTPSGRHRSPTGVPASAWRIAYTICSSENFDRFMGPLLLSRTAETVILLSFYAAVVFRGDVTLSGVCALQA